MGRHLPRFICSLRIEQTMRTHLTTERLLMRPFHPGDALAVAALCGNWKVARMTARIPHPYDEALAAAWIASHDGGRDRGEEHAFCLERNGAVIGAMGLRRIGAGVYELGYWIGEPWWGQGYATEAVGRLMHFAFEDLDARALAAGHLPDNLASGRVLEKCGFTYTGQDQQWCTARNREVAVRRLSLARRNSQEPRAAS